jgi:hypothetical protein
VADYVAGFFVGFVALVNRCRDCEKISPIVSGFQNNRHLIVVQPLVKCGAVSAINLIVGGDARTYGASGFVVFCDPSPGWVLVWDFNNCDHDFVSCFVLFAELNVFNNLFFGCAERVPGFAVVDPGAVGFAERPARPLAVKCALWVAAISA